MILQNIKRLCEANDITFAKLEREAGLGNGTISRWGDGKPRVDKLKLVADYFHVTVDFLLKEDT